MNTKSIGLIGVAALLLVGCGTLNGPQAVANADAQREECKATVVTNAADSMRMQNQPGVPSDEMKQAEGTLALGRLKLHEPRALREPIAPEQSVTSKALRDC